MMSRINMNDIVKSMMKICTALKWKKLKTCNYEIELYSKDVKQLLRAIILHIQLVDKAPLPLVNLAGPPRVRSYH